MNFSTYLDPDDISFEEYVICSVNEIDFLIKSYFKIGDRVRLVRLRKDLSHGVMDFNTERSNSFRAIIKSGYNESSEVRGVPIVCLRPLVQNCTMSRLSLLMED